jgi:hypothetical protein
MFAMYVCRPEYPKTVFFSAMKTFLAKDAKWKPMDPIFSIGGENRQKPTVCTALCGGSV